MIVSDSTQSSRKSRQKSQRMTNRPGKSPQASEPPSVAAEEIQINHAPGAGYAVLDLGPWSFEFVSDFGFRA